MEPTLLTSLLAAGSNAFVAYLRSIGRGYSAIQDALRHRFPLASLQTRQAAESKGTQGWQAAQLMNAGAGNYRVPASAVPRDHSGGLGWRYYLSVDVVPAGQGAQTRREVEVSSSASMTRDELIEAAQQALFAGEGPSGRFRAESIIQSGSAVVGATVYAIERSAV